ncbi:zinc finger protein 852-like [Diaphorina citri]|uniref:Zinc finger protein 852-like n=1 Tax=Diaphorina citri TaxID=121845 RepID=A0A3Q0IX22_DIACI|nr:zinc finger protein 852-like [Diaphorina citri]
MRHMSQVHNKSLIFSKPDDSENKISKVAEKQYWKDVEEKCRIIVEDTMRYQCPHCPSLLKTFWTLKEHFNIHTSEKKYVCELCGAYFIHKSSLVAHTTTHSNVKFKCDFCEKVYSHRNRLRYHISTVHENKWKSAACDICGRVFLDSKNMKKHAAVHSTERPFVCKLCGIAYKWRKNLVRHQKNCKASAKCSLMTTCMSSEENSS